VPLPARPDAAPAPVVLVDAAPVPTVTPDAGTTDEPPDRGEALRSAISARLVSSNTRLSRCYSEATKALPEDQALTGEVDISFEVMPTGGTVNVAVVRNTTESNQLATCLAAVVGGWTFDPFEGDSITFQRTFRFGPSGQR
jgi:hypothetical protein